MINNILKNLNSQNDNNNLTEQEVQQLQLLNKLQQDKNLIYKIQQNKQEFQLFEQILQNVNINQQQIVQQQYYDENIEQITEIIDFQLKNLQSSLTKFLDQLNTSINELTQINNKNTSNIFDNNNFFTTKGAENNNNNYNNQQKVFNVNNFASKEKQVINVNYQIQNILSLSNTKFATVGVSDFIEIWELGEDKPIKQLKHEGSGNDIWALCQLEDNIIATGAFDGDYSIKLFNWKNGELLKTLKAHTNSVRTIIKIIPKYQQFLSAGSDKSMICWNYNSGLIIKKIENAHCSFIQSCIICANQENIVTVGFDSKIKLWSLDTWTCTKQVKIVNENEEKKAEENENENENNNDDDDDDKNNDNLCQNPYCVSLVQIDEQSIAAGGNDGKIRIFLIQDLSCTATFKVHSECIYKILLIDQQFLVSVGEYDNKAKISDFRQKKIIEEKSMQCNNNLLCGLAIMGNKNIITGSYNGKQIIVWE